MRFIVLGSVAVVDGDRHLTVPRAQARGLLALLLLDAGRPVSMAAIEEAMWAGTPPPTARAQVHNAVSSIRALLTRLGAGDSVASGAFGYRLGISPELVDVHRFDRLVGQARVAPDPSDGVRLLREALALWRGEPLADASGAYVSAARAHLVERQLAALEDLADRELRLGRYAELVAKLRPWVAAHPLRERLRARLLIALYRCGRQAEALRDYHAYRRMLAEHEGLDPGAALATLADGILRDDPALVRWPATDASGLPTQSQTAAMPAQLPADIPDFTGRTGHLAQLDAYLGGADDQPWPAVVISAIDGMAGVGKTTLAVHWGRRNRRRFPDGQLYLNLRGYADLPPLTPLEALGRLLIALGVEAGRVPVDVDAAASHFRTLVAGKQILLVLDNAQSAEQVRPLLPGSDGGRVVVTSRNELGGLVAREGARRLLLDVLQRTESLVLLRQTLGPHRVDAEPDATADLAELCAHLPLALRIAAANLAGRPQQPIGDYVAELRSADSRVTELEVPDDPQAAVRTAFDLSYRSLAGGPRRLFRLTGLLPGQDFAAEAAAALAGLPVDQVEADLAELVRRHLVREPEPARFSLHDLLRVYAKDRAEAEEHHERRTAAISRVLGHYLSIVDAAAGRAYPQAVRLPVASAGGTLPFAAAADALEWLRTEQANLVAATLTAASAGFPEMAWRLADALRGYFWICRNTADWLATARAGLAAAQACDDGTAQAAMQLNLGIAHRSLSRYAEAIEHLDVALKLCRKTGWLEGEASSLGSLAIAYGETGQLRNAIDSVTESLALSRRLGRTASEAVQLGNRGNMRLFFGELAEAAADLTGALKLYRQTGNRGGEAIVLGALGLVRYLQGEYATSGELIDGGLRLSREIGDRYGEALALVFAASLHVTQGHIELGIDCGRRALDLARETGETKTEIGALVALGVAARESGDLSGATEHHTEAVRLSRAIGQREELAESLVELAGSRQACGATGEAMACATEALDISGADGYRIFEATALTAIARAHLAQGNPQHAADVAAQALAIHRGTGYRLGTEAAQAALDAALTTPAERIDDR